MKNIIMILFAILIFLSCKKKVIEGTFTIKGRLYLNCKTTTLNNVALELKDFYYENNRPKYQTLSSATTDSKGNFSFTFTNAPDGEVYITYAGSPYPGFINNLPFQNLDSLDVLVNPEVIIKAKLLVSSPYTIKDTLFIYTGGVAGFANYKLIAPFVNGQIIPTTYKSMISSVDYGDYKKKVGLSYRIGSNSNWNDTSSILVKPCEEGIFNIEIK